MRSLFFPTLLVSLLVVPSVAPGEDLDLGGFESCEDGHSDPVNPQPAGAPPLKVAKIARAAVVDKELVGAW